MNAYELADWIENSSSFGHFNTAKQAVNMLRKQADRIGVLEANYEIQKNINDKALQYITELEKDLHMTERHYERLHTQKKPLSDEEIFEIAIPTEIDGTDEEVLTFARAIEERHGIK